MTGIARKQVSVCRGNDNEAPHELHCNLTCISGTIQVYQIHPVTYFVGQQHVSDLCQILLGEDKSHIPFNVGQEPVNHKISC